MARPRKWNSEAERVAAYRASKQMPADEVDPELPVRDVDAPEPDSTERPVEVLLTLDPMAPLTDSEEQVLRDWFGYSKSEKRTRAEREQAAGRIREQAMPPSPEVEEAIRTLRRAEAQYDQKRQGYLAALRQETPAR